MGSKASPPAAPDPYAVAGAQTQSNLSTALTQSYLNNTNQYSPNGSLTYAQTGNFDVQIPDGKGGYQSVSMPQWSQTETLSPAQQTIQDQNNQLSIAGNNLAQSQIDRLTGSLSQPLDTSSVSPVQTSFTGGGPIQNYISSGGPIQTSVAQQMAPTTFGQTAGNIQYDTAGSGNFDAQGAAAQEAIMSRLRPQLEQSQQALDAKLANQGVALGSEAYGTAQKLQGQNTNDAYTQAILAGYQRQNDLFGQGIQEGQFHNAAQNQDYSQLAGRGQFAQAGVGLNNAALLNQGQFANSAQQQQFGQNQANATFANSAQQQQFGENQANATFGNQATQQQLQQLLALRNQPLNEISALRSGGQVSLPQFQGYNAATMQGTPVGQYTYDSAGINEQNYNIQQQQQNALMGGLFGLGSAGLFGLAGGKFSDARLKDAIKRIGTHTRGFGIYAYRYVWGEMSFGYLAQEVEKIIPSAVHTDATGFKSVDYALAA